MKKDKTYLTNLFIENAIIQGQATLNGDYIEGNKASDKLLKIASLIKEDKDFFKDILDSLMTNPEPNVKIWACGIALDIDYKAIEAEQILTEISNMTELGILRFDAEMSLEVRKGNI
ncbi:DUF2019 domain-containing protein [Neobacillus sp. SuZ13]|uniref:DUF2019 domain-containing protein n=1 Tax=Neobacillus sp. SuZ13 TaxID=3047875 RepID=UPI0024BF69EF|nr:DUF2019 domain-containing protein [Neobacillus sp. SuZ13]WHY69608.1 DUF2019 domain-containing protein [Neobacillus sp. SuZ13]